MSGGHGLHLLVCRRIARFGSLRQAARALMISPSYLFRLSTGEKTNPSVATLRKLGIDQLVRYGLKGQHNRA